MDKVYIIEEGTLGGVPYVKIGGEESFSVFKSFDCGQCFRYDPVDGGVSGIAHGRRVTIRRIGSRAPRLGAFRLRELEPTTVSSTTPQTTKRTPANSRMLGTDEVSTPKA